MSWIDKILPSGISRTEGTKRSSVPEGVWTKCVKCEAVLYRPDLERNANVCPKCGHHMRIGARQRLDLFLDDDPREEVFTEIEPIDRLRFRDKKKYSARLAAAQKSTGERDALVAMRGHLHGMPVVAVAFEFGFHGGSMGQAVGEKFSQAAQLALRERMPLVCFAASGGARMQEALISLMQMAKTSAVIERMHSEGVPYISVMTDPIYGGVSASLALLGDLNIAEPEARAGFAGPNIIEQTIRQKLPKGFQRSEFLLEHGAIDMIVPRLELRDTIASVLAKLMGHDPIKAAEEDSEAMASATEIADDASAESTDEGDTEETEVGAPPDEETVAAEYAAPEDSVEEDVTAEQASVADDEPVPGDGEEQPEAVADDVTEVGTADDDTDEVPVEGEGEGDEDDDGEESASTEAEAESDPDENAADEEDEEGADKKSDA